DPSFLEWLRSDEGLLELWLHGIDPMLLMPANAVSETDARETPFFVGTERETPFFVVAELDAPPVTAAGVVTEAMIADHRVVVAEEIQPCDFSRAGLAVVPMLMPCFTTRTRRRDEGWTPSRA